MVPTLMPGDYIFVNKLSYGLKVPFSNLRIFKFNSPKRGDVVVFFPPHEKGKAYVKRLIAKEKEEVILKSGNIYVDDKPLVEPVIAKNYYYNQGKYAVKEEKVTVPKRAYFFLGDNSISSADSRFCGFVPEENILGEAIFIWWPTARINMVE